MYINPYLFILARSPHHIVWNFFNHTKYELDFHYSQRLTQLISCPELFDKHNPVDQAFLTASIMTREDIPTPESLASVDLHTDTLEHITTRLQQPQALQQRVRSGAKVTLQALFSAGFFNIAHNRRLFQNAGYIDA